MNEKGPILEGIIPVLITPLTSEGEIDEESLERLINFLISNNIGGLWVLGTGSEDMSLTYKKRLQVAKAVSTFNKGRVPIILGAGFFAFEDSTNFLNDTADLEVSGYHVMPYHPLLSLERIEWMYKTLADIAEKPLWMYTSANWSKFIPPEFIESMKGYPNIAGVKFSTSNIVHTEKVLSLADNSFQVITAVVRQLFSALTLGAKACTTVEACPYPELIVDIYKKFRQKKNEEALASQRRLNRFLDALPLGPGKDNFLKVAEGKYVLSLQGICQPFMSGYYRELTEEEKQILTSVLKEHGVFSTDINN